MNIRKQIVTLLHFAAQTPRHGVEIDGEEYSSSDMVKMRNTVVPARHAGVSHKKLREALHKKLGTLEHVDAQDPLMLREVHRYVPKAIKGAKTEDEKIAGIVSHFDRPKYRKK